MGLYNWSCKNLYIYIKGKCGHEAAPNQGTRCWVRFLIGPTCSCSWRLGRSFLMGRIQKVGGPLFVRAHHLFWTNIRFLIQVSACEWSTWDWMSGGWCGSDQRCQVGVSQSTWFADLWCSAQIRKPLWLILVCPHGSDSLWNHSTPHAFT